MTTTDQTRLTEALAAIDAAQSIDAIEAQRVAALGKAGWVSAALKTLGSMSPEERQVEGPRIQAMRSSVAAAIDAKKASLEAAALDAQLAGQSHSTPPTGTIPDLHR